MHGGIGWLVLRAHPGVRQRDPGGVGARGRVLRALDLIRAGHRSVPRRATRDVSVDAGVQPWLRCRVRVRAGAGAVGEWVMLTDRLPREPSTRSSVWRKLRRLGVAQLADVWSRCPRTRGPASSSSGSRRRFGRPTGRRGSGARGRQPALRNALASTRAAARAEEYRAVLVQARQASTLRSGERARAGRLLRQELRRIRHRDFVPPAERDAAVTAVEDLGRNEPGEVGYGGEGPPAAGTVERSASRGGRS